MTLDDDGSMPPHDCEMTMDGEKVQIITAGGAAGGKKKKKSKKTLPKKGNAEQAVVTLQNAASAPTSPDIDQFSLEIERSERESDDHIREEFSPSKASVRSESMLDETVEPVKIETLIEAPPPTNKTTELFWLFFCFLGIMASFVVYGILMEYTTSGGRKLHELSFLFVTSGLYTITAAAGRYVREETPTTIPPARFAILGLTSMGSTFCSVRSLRYVFPMFQTRY